MVFQNSVINYFSFIIQGSEHHYGSYSMADRTLCFCCNVSLHRWEPTDEPWSEHERHSSKWVMTSCLLTASNVVSSNMLQKSLNFFKCDLICKNPT